MLLGLSPAAAQSRAMPGDAAIVITKSYCLDVQGSCFSKKTRFHLYFSELGPDSRGLEPWSTEAGMPRTRQA
jgi:hypothetical protein